MKVFVQQKIVMAGLAVCLATAGAFAVRGKRAAAKSAPSASEVLAALPNVTKPTASDREVTKWAEKARQNPRETLSWANLGDALMQKARETGDVSYYGHAEAAYRKALALDAQNQNALIGMAWVNGGRHEFEQSVAWANKVLAVDPNSKEAYGLLGDADVEMGDYNAAYRRYQKMLDLRPDISSYSRGAHLLYLTGKANRAILLMAKAIQTGAPYAENTAWCRAQLALMLLNQGAIPAAENTLQAARKLAPHNYQVLAAMGRVKAAQKDYATAIACYKDAVAAVPQIESLAALGDLYRLTGKPDEAEKQYALVEAVHRLQKANGVRGDMLLARFYADHDRNLPEALKMAEAEYATRKNVFAADTLAWCYYKNGRIKEAQQFITRALSQNTPEPLFHFHAGMIYAQLGERTLAQTELSIALNLNPHFSPVYERVALETLAQMGGGGREVAQRLAAHVERE